MGERESKRSAAFVFQIRLMDLAQIKSLRGLGNASWAVWERVCGGNGCAFRGKYSKYSILLKRAETITKQKHILQIF